MLKFPAEELNNWVEFVKAGRITYPPGGTLGPRIQSTIEFILIHRGEMLVTVDRKIFHAATNTVSIMLPGHKEYYAFSKHEATCHSYLHIAISNMSNRLNEYINHLPKTIRLVPELKTLFEKTLEIQSSNLPISNQLINTISLLILWHYIGECQKILKDFNPNPHSEILEDACQYIETHLHEDIDLGQIAAHAAVCPEHLIRIFKEKTGKTPFKYIWEKRVTRGIDLLENSGLSVEIIAERSGFKTRNHFSRKVKEIKGYSPREIRNRQWNQLNLS